MSTWVLHHREEAFPDPDVFDPTRWIGPPEKLREQERCLVSFSRGTRGCIGQNLAMCEMYVTLAMLFRRFDNLEAFNCGPEDMLYVEAFAAFHPKNARSFRVVNMAK
jgi:cytochrome P450